MRLPETGQTWNFDLTTGTKKHRNLPHRTIAVICVAMLAGVIAAHLQRRGVSSLLIDGLFNSLHGPGFATIAVFVFLVLRIYHRRTTNYLHAAVVAMGIGLLAEAVQFFGPRDASVSDLVADALGIIAGLGFIALLDRDVHARLRTLSLLGLSVITTLAIGATALPTMYYAYAALAQVRAMPVIVSFDDRWERRIYRQFRGRRPETIDAPPSWPQPGQKIGHATEAGRSGVLIHIDPMPDWSNYSTLSFIAASPNEAPQGFIVSIRDLELEGERRGLRFVQEFQAEQEPRRFSIDLSAVAATTGASRSLDLSRIDRIVLLAALPGSDTELYLDDFRLD